MPEENLTPLLAAILRDECPPTLAQLDGAQCQALLQQSQEQGITALLYHHLTRSGALASCPAQLQEDLRRLNLQEAAVHLALSAENREVFQQLTAAGLEFIVLKGEALAWSLYPQPHLRNRCDCDILFTGKDDAEKAWELLSQTGYERGHALEGSHVGLQFECHKTLAGGVVNVLDVHNSLCNNLWLGRRFPFEELRPHSRPLTCQGQNILILDKATAILHNCLHRLNNKRAGTQDRLIWRYDLHLLGNAMTEEEWQDLCTQAGTKQVAALCLEGLEKAEEVFPGTLPAEYKTTLAALAAKEPPPPENLDRPWGTYMKDISTQAGLAGKLGYIWQNLLPAPAYMQQRYQPKRRWHLSYYYVKRLVDFLRK